MMISALADDDHSERRGLLADAGQVEAREERRADDRADDHEHYDHGQERRAAHERQRGKSAASALERRPELGGGRGLRFAYFAS